MQLNKIMTALRFGSFFTVVILTGVFISSFNLTAQAATKPADMSAEQLNKLIDQRVNQRLKALGLSGKGFDKQVAQGIENYIAKQREAQRQAERAPSENAKKYLPRVNTKTDHIKGKKNAIISLIEYSDYECPFCKRFHETPAKLLAEYPGKFNWVYRHFPLSFHNPGAQMQAEATECAAELGGNKAFWKYSDALYERTTSNGKGFPVDNLLPLAKEQGLNVSKFKKCFESRRFEAKVLKQFQEGQKAGVSGTPGNFLINNKTGEILVMHGAQPYAEIKAAIETLLKSKK